MKKIVVLGVGKQGSIVVNEMIKRKTEYVEFATAEDTSEIYKTLNNTDMIFIVFKALGKEQNTDLALKIAKEAKLADILTIAVPISGNAEEEDIQKFKDVSDAIILSSKKFYQYPRRTYLDIEAIVSLIAQKSIGFDEVGEAFHNIGSVFIGVSYTEDCDSDSIHRAYLEARVQIPNKEDNYHNYIINISTDRNTSTDEINEATDKIDRICQQLYRSDTQTNMCGHVFDEKLDGVCRRDCTMKCVRGKSTGGKRNERRQTGETQTQQRNARCYARRGQNSGGLMGQRWHHHSDQQGSAGTYP